MTTPLQTPNAIPIQVPDETGKAAADAKAAGAARTSLGKRILLGLIILVSLFVVTYVIAWYSANSLATRFVQDSENSYNSGDYLNALVGYEKFDDETNKYINIGGYLNVEKIWSSPYSWPQPAYVQQAVERSNEIITEKLTVEQAEKYILENTGRSGTPYFAEIYLRLGELYEQNGDIEDAIDVYQSFASQFPNRKDLIELAQQHLEKLQSQDQ